MWTQVSAIHFGNQALSTLVAAIPVVTLLVLLASGKIPAHLAALIALAAAILVAIVVFTMPPGHAIRATLLGVATGLFPIGWIVLNVIFLYRLTVEKGVFETLQRTIGSITADRRLQLLLIAFAFGAFFEGASGFGTPVAVTGAILMGLGFSPLAASGLSLIANTAPGRLWRAGAHTDRRSRISHRTRSLSARRDGRTPVAIFLAGRAVLVDLDLRRPARNARDLAGHSCLWCVLRRPAICDLQFHQPLDRRHWCIAVSLMGLPDRVSSFVAAAANSGCRAGAADGATNSHWDNARRCSNSVRSTRPTLVRNTAPRLMPWAMVCVILLIWGSGWFKGMANPIFTWNYPVAGLHNMIAKVPPVVGQPTRESAVFAFTYLSFTGTGMLIAAIISGFIMGFSPAGLVWALGPDDLVSCALSLRSPSRRCWRSA